MCCPSGLSDQPETLQNDGVVCCGFFANLFRHLCKKKMRTKQQDRRCQTRKPHIVGDRGGGARRGAWEGCPPRGQRRRRRRGARGGKPQKTLKSPTDNTKPQQTIQSPNRQYKAPTDNTKPQTDNSKPRQTIQRPLKILDKTIKY